MTSPTSDADRGPGGRLRRLMDDPRLWVGLAVLGATGLLAGAVALEHLAGLRPCPMCMMQRAGHAGTALAGLIFLALARPSLRPGGLPRPMARGLVVLGLLTTLAGGGIAAWQAGLQAGLVPAPEICAHAETLSSADGDALLPGAGGALPPPDCADASWRLLGVTLAGWNVLASAGLAGLWALAAYTLRPGAPGIPAPDAPLTPASIGRSAPGHRRR